MSEPFIGEVRIFGFNFAPKGWANCEGQLLPINQNQALFAILGTAYGGNGQTNFALPDLRGRMPMSFGQGPGLTPRNLGERVGQNDVTLTAQQIPAHSHTLRASAATATTATPSAGVSLAPTNGARVYKAPGNTVTSGAGLTSTGGGQPHPNRQPYLALRFCIALNGFFPSPT